MTTITLDLPQEIYERALRKAQTSDRTIEQIIVDWIQPPVGESIDARQSDIEVRLSDLERYTDDELIRSAVARPRSADLQRLQFFLDEQQQRTLSEDERREAEQLVMLEDLQTLQKAKALFLLKQRNALPDALLEITTE
jgi:hypothetical protein